MRTFNNAISVVTIAFVAGFALGLSYGVAQCIKADTAMHRQAVGAAFASMKR